MTTTNMFLNFGGKWDSPPFVSLGSRSYNGQVICDGQNLKRRFQLTIKNIYIERILDDYGSKLLNKNINKLILINATYHF